MNVKKDAAVAISILLALTWVGAVRGQAPSGPPKPGPEFQKLAYFAGKWASEGEMKPSSFGPGGKFTFIQTCEWFAGGFALVCHSGGKMQEGTVKGLNIMGYDPGEKTISISRRTAWVRMSLLAVRSKATRGPGRMKAR